MTIGFPPKPVYPLALDSDKTLFKVYNTSQAKLKYQNSAWSEELAIEPVIAGDEQWGNNGFANISGELFYYDNVETDVTGKINKLKNCARNLGGKRTAYNKKGTWVRGFVVAEHHNQLVDAVILTEKYLLELQDEIKKLENQPSCADDALCPEVTFKTTKTKSSNCIETILNYEISIIGSFTSFILDFGDGQSTNSPQSGSHTYSLNSKVDPVIRISNDTCTIVQTPIERTDPTEPTTVTPTIPTIPIPPPPVFPEIVIPDCIIPEINWGFDLPQIVLPQIDINCSAFSVPTISFPSTIVIPNISLEGISIPSTISILGPVPPSLISIIGPSIPSLISIIGPDIPSLISIIGPDIPSIINGTITVSNPGGGEFKIPDTITISPDTITVDSNIPTNITVNSNIPTNITVNSNIPTNITVSGDITVPPIPNISVYVPEIPDIIVDWGKVPTINVNVTCNCCPSSSSGGGAFTRNRPLDLDDDFIDDFENDPVLGLELDSNSIGIPSEIQIIAPEFPDIRIKHDIPNFISLISDLPTKIELFQNNPIVHEFTIINDSLPSKIEVVATNLPTSIRLDSSELPNFISLLVPTLPDIKIDASGIPDSIRVVGIPDVINVNMPSEIKARLELPENLEIPLVYKGGPVPVQFDSSNLLGDDDRPCFALVPCGSKK
jgi:hypothetical protein